jgi:ribonuclease J
LPKYRDEKVLVITTGGQGEQNAGLSKMVNGEHKVVSIKEGDLVVFSASVIPGNERDLQVLQDNLCRQGAVVMKSNEMDIHSSGHAPKEDLKMVMEIMKPKYFIPCHGYYFMRAANAQIGWEAGIPKDRTILSDNGLIVEITPETVRITKQSIPSSFVMVDGLGVGDVEEVVLRDRKNLSEEGMLITIVTLSRQTGRILKNPDIISRGFIHLKNNQQFVEDMREKTKLIMEKMAHGTQPEAEYVRTLLREQLGQYIFTKTQRRPMIIPVVIEV